MTSLALYSHSDNDPAGFQEHTAQMLAVRQLARARHATVIAVEQ